MIQVLSPPYISDKIQNMPLALFDLDNTLLAGDSDYLWGHFLVQKGLVDKQEYEQTNEAFYEDYKKGRLDIYAFLEFSLKPLANNEPALLQLLHEEFMFSLIEPIITQTGRKMIEHHRAAGDQPIIITATNSFVTGPIAKAFGVDDLIATEAEFENGLYTGKISGTPCFQHGKIERLQEWMLTTNTNLENSWFYSDSHNDLSLLEQVTNPVVVDADEQLTVIAKERGWKLTSFR